MPKSFTCGCLHWWPREPGGTRFLSVWGGAADRPCCAGCDKWLHREQSRPRGRPKPLPGLTLQKPRWCSGAGFPAAFSCRGSLAQTSQGLRRSVMWLWALPPLRPREPQLPNLSRRGHSVSAAPAKHSHPTGALLAPSEPCGKGHLHSVPGPHLPKVGGA